MEPLAADDPRTIGDYRLLRRLGAGGMGRVFLGRSPGGRTVAVKVVHAHFAVDDQFRTRFRREIEAARRVGGGWTAPVLDADPDAATPWVATGYVAGPSLQQAVDTHGPLPEHSVRALGAGLGEALETVHRLDLVHRDVKPSNVLLTLDGPRLIDFGIARATDSTASLTATGVSVGSPGYMSPEQVLSRDIDDRTDVFSLGAVLAFAATGGAPFPGDNSAGLLYKVVHEPPELVGADALDRDLRETLLACLDKDPAGRPSAREVARRLAGESSAATLVAAGWLPAPVIEGVSRRAVQLLELEAEPATPAPPTYTPTAVDGFGPPDPSYGGGSTVPPSTGPPPGSGPPPGTGGGRGKRGLLIGAAAVAVAAVATGAFFLFSQDDGGNGGSGGAGGSSAGSSAGTGSDSGGESGGGEDAGAVPEEFIGTWKGTTVTANTRQANRYEITIKGGEVGEVVARDDAALGIGDIDCSGDYKLVSATDSKLVLDTSGGENPHPGICSNGSDEEVFTLQDDGTLRYESGDAAAGNPKGDLTKQD